VPLRLGLVDADELIVLSHSAEVGCAEDVARRHLTSPDLSFQALVTSTSYVIRKQSSMTDVLFRYVTRRIAQ
jgi:hypothetical protein